MVASIAYAPRNISDHSLPNMIIISNTHKIKLWKVNPFWFTLFPESDPILRVSKMQLRYSYAHSGLGCPKSSSYGTHY